ncbi:hypothetical protein Tco_0712604 [Tanacetum coccineum]
MPNQPIIDFQIASVAKWLSDVLATRRGGHVGRSIVSPYTCSYIRDGLVLVLWFWPGFVIVEKAKIAVEERITRSVFGVKEIDLGEEEAPYWTTLGRRESYGPRLSTDGIGAQTLFNARKDFLDHHLPEEWELARDAELNPFKDILVFRKMVKFLGIIPINLKGNMWELEELVENQINWDRSPKEGDGA